MKSGNLNFLEPSGPLQVCNGTALLPLPPQTLPKHLSRMLHSASSFNFQYFLVSLRSFSSCQRLFTSSRPFYFSLFSFGNVFSKAVPPQDVTNPDILPSSYIIWNVPFLLDPKQYLCIFHMIGPTELLHPSPPPHFKIFQVFLICCAPNVAFHSYPRPLKSNSNLVMKWVFFLLNADFTTRILDIFSPVHNLHHLLSGYPNSWYIPHFPAAFELSQSVIWRLSRYLITLVLFTH